MIRAFVIAAALAVSIAATPAIAADATSLGCIESELGAPAIAEIRETVAKALIAGGTVTSSFDMNRFDEPLRVCAARYGWSDAAKLLAVKFARAHLLQPSLERGLIAGGGDPAQVMAAYRELSPKQRYALGMGEDSQEASEAIVPRLQAHKVPLTDPRSIGRLVAALSIIEFASDDFAKL